jgi:Ca2+-binding EF-hand superfamily protein
MQSPKSLLTAVILTLAMSPAAMAAVGGSGGQDLAKKGKPPHSNQGRGNGQQGNNGGHGEDLTHIRFADLDTNHDGRITRDEWRGNNVSFNEHDWNGDGVLSGIEVIPGAQRPADFSSLDRNHDGRISLSEWRGCRGLFDLLDVNDDGFLTQTELGQNGGMLATGNLQTLFLALDVNADNRISSTEWALDPAVFSRLDTDHDTFLSLNELRGIRDLLCEDDDDGGDDDEGDLEDTFRAWDTNHDNQISRSEWRASARLFDRLDTNHDGFLSLAEFLNR